jgi:hypothetical protein
VVTEFTVVSWTGKAPTPAPKRKAAPAIPRPAIVVEAPTCAITPPEPVIEPIVVESAPLVVDDEMPPIYIKSQVQDVFAQTMDPLVSTETVSEPEALSPPARAGRGRRSSYRSGRGT